MKYCIVCMKTVNILAFCDLLSPIVMDYHFVEEEHHFFRSCEGPFAETPPPAELEEDWQDHLTEETHTEMIIDELKCQMEDYLSQ